MLIMTSIIRVGQSQFSSVPIDEDAQERILNCLQSLAATSILPAHASTAMAVDPASPGDQEQEVVIREIFLEDTQKAYSKMVQHQEVVAQEKREKESTKVKVQVDDLIGFRQFAKKSGEQVDEVRPCLSFV